MGGGGKDSSITDGSANCDKHNKCNSTNEIRELSKMINEHGKKMVFVAKMKCEQREKELSYAKQAEICNSICTLGSEKRQLMIDRNCDVLPIEYDLLIVMFVNINITITIIVFLLNQ